MRNRRRRVVRGGHLGAPKEHGFRGELVDRIMPGRREEEFRGAICEFGEIPVIRDQRERHRLESSADQISELIRRLKDDDAHYHRRSLPFFGLVQ